MGKHAGTISGSLLTALGAVTYSPGLAIAGLGLLGTDLAVEGNLFATPDTPHIEEPKSSEAAAAAALAGSRERKRLSQTNNSRAANANSPSVGKTVLGGSR